MNKEIRLGIMYNEGEAPDFGSILQNPFHPNILYLLAEDIPKLNGMLTRTAAESYLPKGISFNFHTGALAFVVDHKAAGTGKIYAYHRGKDHWYEFNIRSDPGLFKSIWNRHARILREAKEISGVLPLTFNSNGRPLKNYRIYGNIVNEESVGDLVTEGEYAGKYHVPIMITNGTLTHTVSIYLPEQIKMVGNEAEYIDCKKQKQHRVRKNLFDYITHTQNTTAGYLLSDNQRTNSADWVITDYIPCDGETFTINPIGGNTTSICLYDENKNFICGKAYHTGGAHIKTSVTITSTQNASYIRFSYNTGGTGTQIDNISNIMLNAGSEPLSYEPYIEDTELDVALPALPTFSGTNTITFGTTVQPSAIEIKGKINQEENS